MKKTAADKDALSVKSILWGVIAALLTSVIIAGVVALMTGKGILPEENMKTAMIITAGFATLIGCVWGTRNLNSGVTVGAGVVSAIYLAVLLVGNQLLIDGGLQGLLPTLISACIGYVAAILLKIKSKNTKKGRKIKVR